MRTIRRWVIGITGLAIAGMILLLATPFMSAPLAGFVQRNPYPMKALSSHGIMITGGMGEAWIESYSVPFFEVPYARWVLINDAREHHYCLTMRVGGGWKHYDDGVEDPNLYDYPYSKAFMRERQDAATRFMADYRRRRKESQSPHVAARP